MTGHKNIVCLQKKNETSLDRFVLTYLGTQPCRARVGQSEFKNSLVEPAPNNTKLCRSDWVDYFLNSEQKACLEHCTFLWGLCEQTGMLACARELSKLSRQRMGHCWRPVSWDSQAFCLPGGKYRILAKCW